MTTTDRPPIGSTVRVSGLGNIPLTGKVTRWVGEYTIEVTGIDWQGLYAPEGVVVVDQPR